MRTFRAHVSAAPLKRPRRLPAPRASLKQRRGVCPRLRDTDGRRGELGERRKAMETHGVHQQSKHLFGVVSRETVERTRIRLWNGGFLPLAPGFSRAFAASRGEKPLQRFSWRRFSGPWVRPGKAVETAASRRPTGFTGLKPAADGKCAQKLASTRLRSVLSPLRCQQPGVRSSALQLVI